jgi:hypothetical protein
VREGIRASMEIDHLVSVIRRPARPAKAGVFSGSQTHREATPSLAVAGP